MPVSTCRLAHLSLPRSELHVGLCFDGHPRVEELVRRKGTAVLFPGEGSTDVSACAEPPEVLIVIDGTWANAKKVLERNAALRALPRIGVNPERPGNYRIRREPAAHCLSTVEAVVEVLGRLEGAPERFRPILGAFDQLVESQLHFARTRTSPPRRRAGRQRTASGPELPPALSRPEHLVAVYAEANAYPRGSEVETPAELVQLVAVRVASGEQFQALIAPRRPLAPGTPLHLELSAERLLSGEPVSRAMERWRQFLREQDVLCGWGRYALDLLLAEGAPERPFLDVRAAVARFLSRQPGGVERAAQLVSGQVGDPWSEGRAGRRIAALLEVLQSLGRE